jgi:hypothetical protein
LPPTESRLAGRRRPDGDDRLLTGPRGGGSTAHVHRQR